MTKTILRLKCYTESFYIDIILEQNKVVEYIYNIFTVPCEKSNMLSFASSIIKKIAVFAFLSRDRFPVKLVYCFAFG